MERSGASRPTRAPPRVRLRGHRRAEESPRARAAGAASERVCGSLSQTEGIDSDKVEHAGMAVLIHITDFHLYGDPSRAAGGAWGPLRPAATLEAVLVLAKSKASSPRSAVFAWRHEQCRAMRGAISGAASCPGWLLLCKSPLAPLRLLCVVQVPKPDAILLTGDFTHDDTPESYISARDIIKAAFPSVPLLYTPGCALRRARTRQRTLLRRDEGHHACRRHKRADKCHSSCIEIFLSSPGTTTPRSKTLPQPSPAS